ncbi:MAG: EAL domain-containing protein [Desulfobacterales bacterium]|nr:EAL domain-containing protein [Desulfobacterales bacterium]
MESNIITENDKQKILDLFFKNSIIGFCITDNEGIFVEVNKAYCDIYGYKKNELIGKSFLIVVPEDKKAEVSKIYKESMIDGKEIPSEWKAVKKDKSLINIQVTANIFTNNDGKKFKITTVSDITERKKFEMELKKLSMAIEESINIVFITDLKGIIEYVNPMFEKITGYSSQEAIGQVPSILASGETTRAQYSEFWKTIKSGKTWRGDFKNKKKNGEFYWAKGLVSPIKNELNQISHFLAIQEDVSAKMIAEQKAEYLTNYDGLTGLLNRDKFIEKLEKQIATIDKGCFVISDLDGFKDINDIYGHNFANDFFKRLIGIMKQKLAENLEYDKYLIGRLGEDDIGILFQTNSDETFKIIEDIRKNIESFRFTDKSIQATVSSGIVQFPEYGKDIQVIISNANMALHRSKIFGKNKTSIFTDKDKELQKIHTRLHQKDKILKALDEDRFEIYFQPLLDLKTNEIHHYEVLARMRGEDGRIILPGYFIPAAEAFGLISYIDKVITKKAIKYQSDLMKQGQFYTFAMNLSGKELGDDDMLNYLKEEIKSVGADPKGLVFEITETAAIHDIDRAIKFINSLQSMGCSFSLDDFGVGFTSFTYLRDMNVDFIKIDGAFVKRIKENKTDKAIVKSINTIAKEMKIKTIAEFVEDEATLKILKELEVDFGQGFLIGKPAPTLISDRLFR